MHWLSSNVYQAWMAVLPRRLPGKIVRFREQQSVGIQPLIEGLPGANGLIQEFQGECESRRSGAFVTFEWHSSQVTGEGPVIAPVVSNVQLVEQTEAEQLRERIRQALSSALIEQLEHRTQILNEQERLVEERRRRLEAVVAEEVGKRLRSRTRELDERKRRLDERERCLGETVAAQVRVKLQSREEGLAKREEQLKAREDQLARTERSLREHRQQLQRQQQHVADRERILTRYEPVLDLFAPPAPVERRGAEAHPSSSQWVEFTRAQGFFVPDAVAHEFLVSLVAGAYAGNLVLLTGSVGVGKTSIVEHAARFLGGDAAIIPIRPGWLDPSDLLGFYDPIHRVFQPGPLAEALARAARDRQRMYLICLDELNLGRVENYAADLLSTLEYARPRDGQENSETRKLRLYPDHTASQLVEELRSLRVANELRPRKKERRALLERNLRSYPPQLEIPENVVVVGTLNADETTYQLSPKVIDRSYVIGFPPPQDTRDLGRLPKSEPSAHPSGSLAPSQLRKEISRRVDRPRPGWDQIVEWNARYLQALGTPLGYRARRDYALFTAAAEVVGLEEERAYLYYVQTKVLPRIGFAKDGSGARSRLFQEWLDRLAALDSEVLGLTVDRLREQLEDEEQPVVRYWQ